MKDRKELYAYVVLDPVTMEPVLMTENYTTAFDIAKAITEKPEQICDLIKRVPVIQPVWCDE